MTQVFISYSRKDLAFVEQLAADLQAAGLDVWYDLSGLEGGSRWSRELEKAIRESQYVLVALSPDSVSSKWVEEEFLYASELGKKIIPLFYRQCSIPFGYRTLHFIDIQGDKYKQKFNEILRAIDVEKVMKEKAPVKTKNFSKKIDINNEAPEQKDRTNDVSPSNLDISGSISESVIVIGSGNVITMSTPHLGKQQTLDIQIGFEEIKTQIQFGLYIDAYKKCIALLTKEVSNPLINLLGCIAYILDKGENKLRDSDMQIINKHISLAIPDSRIRPTALAVLGCIKYGYYYLNKIYDPSNLTLELIKEELQKCSTLIDKELLGLIDPTEYALYFLGIQ